MTIQIARTVVTTRPPVVGSVRLGGRICGNPGSNHYSQCGRIGDEMEEAVVVHVDGGRRGGKVIGAGGCNAGGEVARGAGKAVDAGGTGKAGEDLEGWLAELADLGLPDELADLERLLADLAKPGLPKELADL